MSSAAVAIQYSVSRRLNIRLIWMALLLLAPGWSWAQDSVAAAVPGPSSTVTSELPQNMKGDVVVIGTPDGPFPVTVDAGSYRELRVTSRDAALDARFFSRCVKPFDNGSLHELIDGKPNRDIRASALNRIIRGYMACYPGYDETVQRDYGSCNTRVTTNPQVTLCQSFYDRGALVEKMLKDYAPGLSFTTQQLADRAVTARFHAREDAFNTTRAKSELIYAEVASCVVAMHPQLGLSLLNAEPFSRSEDRIRATLLGTSRPCVGGAIKVTVDPSQFRIYVADAVYSWAVALKNVTSLIPYSPKRSLLP